MRQSGWRVSSPDKSEFSLSRGILEIDEGVSEWGEAIGDSVFDIAVNVGVSYEAMDDFGSTH